MERNIQHYSWKEIDKELGKNSWIISRRTDGIRCFGFYRAYKDGADYLITLDDDAYPSENISTESFIGLHQQMLDNNISRWLWTTKDIKPRGVPYFNTGKKEVLINMGFWKKNPDIDAPTQLVHNSYDLEPNIMRPVPSGFYFPLSACNFSFKRKATPIMYFPLMGLNQKYDRFGDIWCGIITKKICDYLGYVITSGFPSVNHIRASDVWKNLQKEVPGLYENEFFWEIIDNMKLTGNTLELCYLQIAEQLPDRDYYRKLGKAMRIWLTLFD